MLTPFKMNGAVDYFALEKLSAYYIDSGASGLFANCLSSEMYELDESERMKVVKTVVNAAAGAVPVVATGSFGRTLRDKADFIKKVHSIGVDAVIAITSLLAEQNESDEVFNRNVIELLSLTEKIPLGFYECPAPYKRVISPEQLRAFVATGRIIYHKDTCLNIEIIKRKVKATNKYNFGLYDAYMGHAVASLEAGAAGLSCIQGNFFPELIVWLCDHYNNDRLTAEVKHVQQFFLKNMKIMHLVYPTTAKYYLQQQGIDITTYTRSQNSRQLDSEIIMALDKLFGEYATLKEKLELRSVSAKA
jgi:4-hydroxy-tetrahydrodipicolinate synthase